MAREQRWKAAGDATVVRPEAAPNCKEGRVFVGKCERRRAQQPPWYHAHRFSDLEAAPLPETTSPVDAAAAASVGHAVQIGIGAGQGHAPHLRPALFTAVAKVSGHSIKQRHGERSVLRRIAGQQRAHAPIGASALHFRQPLARPGVGEPVVHVFLLAVLLAAAHLGRATRPAELLRGQGSAHH